jgi:hypothetical protein
MNRCLVIIILVFLTGLQSLNAGPVKIIQAIKAKWVSGAPGGRSGTNYDIVFQLLCKSPIEFTGVWLNGKEVSFDVGAFNTDPNYKPMKGDTLTITVNLTNGEEESIKGRKVPVKAKGEGLLEVKTKKGFKYVAISKFENANPILGQ